VDDFSQPRPPSRWFVRFSVGLGALALVMLIARQFFGATPSLSRNIGMGLIALVGLSAPIIENHRSPLGLLHGALLLLGVVLLSFLS